MSNTPKPKKKLFTLDDMIRDQKSPSGKSLDLQQIQRPLSSNSEYHSVEEFLREVSSEKEKNRPVRNPSPGVSVFSSETSAKTPSKRPTPLKASSNGESSRPSKNKSSISRILKKKVINLWKK